MIKGVIVTHGELGRELIDTARGIIGDVAECYAVSNRGKSPERLYQEIVSVAGADGAEPCMMFVDFFGSSCGPGCLRVEHTRGNARIISGVNLPMLLAFLTKRDEMPFDQLSDALIERGKGSIRVLDTNKL